ncbi:hypothetical protein QYE76_021516 [Lolium multiflorum]|uniref:Uncharacterized protein n=1 Tax=Lolium multiflorum TaxID=4521 RepID=A0AAD8R9N6_LOLMU|nr:hypothetical protein QYE76_021516 [Lolium multiflorum]
MALETTPKFGSCSCSSPMAAEQEALDQMIAPPDEEDYCCGRRGRMGLFGILPCDTATNCKRRRVLLVRYHTMNTRGSVWRRAFWRTPASSAKKTIEEAECDVSPDLSQVKINKSANKAETGKLFSRNRA